jgi:hypothetical protein
VVGKGKRATTNLASLFHGHALQPGAKVTVIVHPSGRDGAEVGVHDAQRRKAASREGRLAELLSKVLKAGGRSARLESRFVRL